MFFFMTEEVDLYRWLVDHIEHYQTDITLVLPKLLSGKPETKPLIDGTTHREVSSLSLLYCLLLPYGSKYYFSFKL